MVLSDPYKAYQKPIEHAVTKNPVSLRRWKTKSYTIYSASVTVLKYYLFFWRVKKRSLVSLYSIPTGQNHLAVSHTHPVNLIFTTISAQSGKQQNEREAGRRPFFENEGNLCSAILSHLSTAARLQSRHAETETALGRADKQCFCTVTVCGSCN